MIKPTVGRVVHYYPAADDLGAKPDHGQPLAALIARVWSDTCVNLAYMDANGVSYNKTSVLLVQDDDAARPGSGYCAWMPYQKGQAAKTESLERQVAGIGEEKLNSWRSGSTQGEGIGQYAGMHTTGQLSVGGFLGIGQAVNKLLETRIPILDQLTELCWAIEKCGASPELTDAVTKASALREPISELVRQALALGIGAGIVSVNVSPEPSPAAVDAIEQEIQAKGLTAPRITPADIEATIVSEHYFTAGLAATFQAGPIPDSLHLLTFCVLVLRNGFTVTGESACASPENFDAEIGQKIARQNALREVGKLEGYLLRERLHQRAVFDAEPKTGLGAQE